MDIEFGTLDSLLTAIEKRLQDKLALDQARCFISDAIIPPELLDEFCVTISFGDGKFDEALFEGGGHLTLAERCSIYVGIFRTYRVDRNDQSRLAMISKEKGLFARDKRSVLRALLVDDPSDTPTAPWQPVYNNQQILRDDLLPVSCTRPQPAGPADGDPDHLYIVLTFSAYFDWSL